MSAIRKMKNCIKLSSKFSAFLFCLFIGTFDAKALDIKQIKTATGLKLWLVEDHKNPIVTIKFSFKGGTSQDTPKLAGVVNLLSGLLDEGAGDFTSEEFQKELNENSISMSFSASRDNFEGSLVTLTETFDVAVELLSLAINKPRFDPEPLNRVKDQVVSSIRSSEEKPNNLVGRVWWKGAFGAHPYGFPKRGTEASIGKITRADLQEMKKNLFAKDNLIIGVVGNISESRLKSAIDKVFGKLGNYAKLKDSGNAIFQNHGETIVVERKIPQSVVVFGQEGILRNHPDWFAALILFEVLSGGFGSRLTEEIREKRGLTYSVSAYPLPMENAGLILGSVSTKNSKVKQTVLLIKKVWKEFSVNGPTKEEVENAKSYLKGSYGLQFTNSRSIAGLLVALQRHKLGVDYLTERSKLIEDVTLSDLKRVAKQLFNDDKLMFAIIGTPENMKSSISIPALD